MRKMKSYSFIFLFFSMCCFNLCCRNKSALKQASLFTPLSASATGLQFSNTLKPTADFNMLKYMYYYNGAGVGAGDFNKDGKTDLFFGSNQGKNALYLNEGGMHFKDVTADAAIPDDGGWSTGISVVDINNDSLLDIYICRVGKYKILNGKNSLLICKEIKNGIPVFKDETEQYGLSFSGFSTQAAFLDFDNDGDLDMFLLNHSVNHDGNYSPRKNFENTYDSLAGDQFFRNDNSRYTNITKLCGINSTKIGYGLGITVSDINLDGWPDIYIGNDFHENDYLYINQKNGVFKEALNDHIMHTSQFSMGVDVADINNDAYPDVISMDMLPYDPFFLKGSLAEDAYQTLKSKLQYGYNYQYARNNLQLNQRNGMFAEVAFYSGIGATDWSWSCLWMDFDNDGNKDLFVSNGIPKRLNDIDYVNYMIDDLVQDKLAKNKMEEKDLKLIDKFPEVKLPNRFFKNIGNAKFEDVSDKIADNPKTFSNGTVYADLDNDGDLDIVVNNILDPVLLYQNNAVTSNTSVDITCTGVPGNINALGTRCYVFKGKEIISYEKYPVRGFLSSMETPLHVGYGSTTPDSVLLVWPDNTYEKISFDTGKHNMKLVWKKGLPVFNYSQIATFNAPLSKRMADITAETGLQFLHSENDFNEFNREILLPKMYSTEGPALACEDVNGDGLEDIFIGSSKWKPSALFFQTVNGKFIKSLQPLFLQDSTYEDVAATFADVNNDGYKDIIIASGGNEFYSNDKWMQPRIYLNDGKGFLTRSENPFPGVYATQSCVAPCDFNNDGFIDFFIGSRAVPFNYGKVPTSFLLQNDGTGHFIDVTNQRAKDLSNAGFVTNAVWTDINNDRQKDLVLTLEWGGITAFVNTGGNFNKKEIVGLHGWWNVVLPVDVDNDGDIDFIAGNQGLNARVNPTAAAPLKMYYNDFDNNGTKEQVVTFFQMGREVTLAGKIELERQMPFLKKKFLYAQDFAGATINEIFTAAKIKESQLYTADYFSNACLLNDGRGNFTVSELPWQAQLACIKDAVVFDANGDELPDILTGGNFYEQAMEFNRYDAGFGTVLINKGGGNFSAENVNGLIIKNQVRHILPILLNKKPAYVVARNNDSLLIIQ
jgi:enediyne biosynthesis protein E4